MEKRSISFSPPDISEDEINEVAETLRSGWITTGPRVKEFEKRLSDYYHTRKTVCLSSATAAEELILRIIGIERGVVRMQAVHHSVHFHEPIVESVVVRTEIISAHRLAAGG